MKDQNSQYEDDGRVICDMDVAGMKWHDRRVRSEQKHRASRGPSIASQQMDGRQWRNYTFYAVLAGLAVVAVFAVTWIALILFMTKVWFR